MLELHRVPATSDAELLERFATEHDEDAFAELVRRASAAEAN